MQKRGQNFSKNRMKSEILNLRFHDIRHTAATRMVSAGIDLVVELRNKEKIYTYF